MVAAIKSMTSSRNDMVAIIKSMTSLRKPMEYDGIRKEINKILRKSKDSLRTCNP